MIIVFIFHPYDQNSSILSDLGMEKNNLFSHYS